MKLLKFEAAECNNVVTGLRNLANAIEKGSFGDVQSLAWVIDSGLDSEVEVGLLGKTASYGPEAYLLLALGQNEILKGV